MNNTQRKELCLALMRADSEREVTRILTEAGYWDNKRVWRLHGDRENNFSTIGNQQNRPDAALVEKLINSVKAWVDGHVHLLQIPSARADSRKKITQGNARRSSRRLGEIVLAPIELTVGGNDD